MEGAEYIEALAGAVGEAGEASACLAVCEGERYLERFYARCEEVEGHADLGAEAGGYAGEGVEGRGEEGALAGEGFCGGVAGAARYLVPGEVLYKTEPSLRGGREGGYGDGVVFVEGGEEGSEEPGRVAEVGVGEEYRVRVIRAGAQDAEAEGVSLAGALAGG